MRVVSARAAMFGTVAAAALFATPALAQENPNTAPTTANNQQTKSAPAEASDHTIVVTARRRNELGQFVAAGELQFGLPKPAPALMPPADGDKDKPGNKTPHMPDFGVGEKVRLGNIAGICNEKRNVAGLMPHPERACEPLLGSADGKFIFESVIHALQSRLAKAA